MAKKTVATLKTGDGRGYAKVIKMVKSPKTGAYMFKEQMVTTDQEIRCFFYIKEKRFIKKRFFYLIYFCINVNV